MKKLTKAEKKKKQVTTMALLLAIMLVVSSAMPLFAIIMDAFFSGSSTSEELAMVNVAQWI